MVYINITQAQLDSLIQSINKRAALSGATFTGPVTGTTFTGALNGNATTATTATTADTATKLATPRTINGVSFDGSANITVGADAVLPTQTSNGGKFLTTDGTASSWVSPKEVIALADGSDVSISSPTTGQILIWSGTAWVNGANNYNPPQVVKEYRVAMAANNIDLSAGSLFTKTISAATTLTVSNVAAAGLVNSFILELINPGTNITWFANIRWASGTVPTLTVTGKDVIGFYSYDGGSNWIGNIIKDVK